MPPKEIGTLRNLAAIAVLLLIAFAALPVVAQQDAERPSPFKRVVERPLIAIHEVPQVTDKAFVTVSGVVFSRTPVDRVRVGDRNALVRPAEPADLVRLDRVPDGASDAPFRTYFEVPDASLVRHGANDLDVRALSTEGVASNVHRVTVVRTLEQSETQSEG